MKQVRLLFPVLTLIGGSFLTSTYAQDRNILLVGRNSATFQMWDGTTMRGFGFAPGIGAVPLPGPTLFMNEGDSVIIDFWNISQGAPHTIHLHGMDVNQENDGVPHLSFDVRHMEHGYYRFKAPHAGTYLYHCHVVSTIHVQAGMYGLVVVRPPHGLNETWEGGYWYDVEQRWLASEIDTFWHKDSVLNHPHDTGHSILPVRIPEYHPQYFLINGKSEQELNDGATAIRVHENETMYLRIANVGYTFNQIEFPASLNPLVVSSDGRPLPNGIQTTMLQIYPGERYGVLLRPKGPVSDSVRYAFHNLNTNQLLSEQHIPVYTNFLSVENPRELMAHVLYPNPVKDLLFVQLAGSQEQEGMVTIHTVEGRRVMGQMIRGSGSLNLQKLDDGTYFAHIEAGGVISRHKLLIHR